MGERLSIKTERDEQNLFNFRIIIAAVLILFALVGITVRAYNLQVVEYSKYAELSREHYQKRIPIPPNRGQIYDRNGVLLAGSHVQYVLLIVRDSIGDENKDGKTNFKDVEGVVARLGKLISLSEQDVRIFSQNAKKFKYEPIPIKVNLTEEEVAKFSVNRPHFPGVTLEIRMERYYPMHEVASHVIGYVGRIDERDLELLNKDEYLGTSHIGKTGVEASHEGRLHGQAGYHLVEVDAYGKQQSVIDEKSPVGGQDLFLGLDIKTQITAENLLKEEGKGAIVALDPRTGEVLALASVPTFDPNLFIDGISSKDYSDLNTNPDRPLYNRALQGVYPPGSTVKPMAGMAGLISGTMSPGSRVNDPGFFRLSGQKHVFRCWNKHGHGSVDLKLAITQSCDTYFYTLANRMGIDEFSSYMFSFGFGKPTGVDLPSEASGLMPTPAWKERRYKTAWYPGDTVSIGIGQGYWLATPMQLAHAASVMANRGLRVKPHILRSTRIAANREAEIIPPEYLEPVKADDKAWDVVLAGMKAVMMPGGTARAAGAGAPYQIAGKTGTAQVFGLAGGSYNAGRLAKRLRDHALFVGFAPADDPKIAVGVVVENASGSGGHTAAPIARKVMDAYLLKKYIDNVSVEPETKQSVTGTANTTDADAQDDPHD
jgi:penicillin-binding protein 2